VKTMKCPDCKTEINEAGWEGRPHNGGVLYDESSVHTVERCLRAQLDEMTASNEAHFADALKLRAQLDEARRAIGKLDELGNEEDAVLGAVISQRDEWKARAEAAERANEGLRVQLKIQEDLAEGLHTAAEAAERSATKAHQDAVLALEQRDVAERGALEAAKRQAQEQVARLEAERERDEARAANSNYVEMTKGAMRQASDDAARASRLERALRESVEFVRSEAKRLASLPTTSVVLHDIADHLAALAPPAKPDAETKGEP
jgi:hypothetical protein